MKLLFYVAVCLFVIISCNKDKKAIKSVQGKWVEFSINQVPVQTPNAFEFYECKTRKVEYCTGKKTLPDESVEDFEFQITEDGTEIYIRNPETLIGLKSDIITLDDSVLTISTIVFGDTTITELKRKED